MIRISDLETGQLVKFELNSQLNSEVVIIGEIQNIYKTLMFGVDYHVLTVKLENGELRKVHQSEICNLEVMSKDNVITEEQFYCTAGEIIASVVEDTSHIEELLILFTTAMASELFGADGINDNQPI